MVAVSPMLYRWKLAVAHAPGPLDPHEVCFVFPNYHARCYEPAVVKGGVEVVIDFDLGSKVAGYLFQQARCIQALAATCIIQVMDLAGNLDRDDRFDFAIFIGVQDVDQRVWRNHQEVWTQTGSRLSRG